jgi:TolB-like protein/class 3 adenylate cyclase
VTQAPVRKLAVLLHADVVGSTLLVQKNETLAHERIQDAFRRFSETIRNHGGIAHEIRGDALVAEFSRASDAVSASLTFQTANDTLNEQLPDDIRPMLRIGIAMGEVIIADNTITGEGIVLAQRLEQLAENGGTCIQGAAYETLPKRLPFEYENLGERQVKGFNEPVKVFAVSLKPGCKIPESETVTRLDSVGLDLPSKPSIAVLPFENMSGDHEQEYFSDGITEDIITSLSVWRSFPVISRHSTFTYKNRNLKVQQVAEELGARYVLEGSVRRSGSRVRVTAQLTDAETGHSLWAQNFDRDLEDIFAVQDEITQHITAAVVPEFEQVETKRSATKNPNNLDAWDFYLRGLSFVHKSTKDGNARAHDMFSKALELEPDYGPALSGVAYVLNRDLLLDNVKSIKKTALACLEAAKRAVDLDESAAISRTELVRALLWCRQHEAAIREAIRAVELNPSNALAQGWLGAALVFAGREDEGIPRLENALELAPRDPRNRFFMTHLALAYLNSGQLESALNWARLAAQRETDFIEAPVALASILAHSGKEEEARTILTQFDIRNISSIEARPFWRRYLYSTTTKLVFDGLRKAVIVDKPTSD